MAEQTPEIRIVTLARHIGTSMFQRHVRDEDGNVLRRLRFLPGDIHILSCPNEIAAVQDAIDRGALAEAEFTEDSLIEFVKATAPKAAKKRIEALENRVRELEAEVEASVAAA